MFLMFINFTLFIQGNPGPPGPPGGGFCINSATSYTPIMIYSTGTDLGLLANYDNANKSADPIA